MKLQSERQKTAEREAREKAREARQAVSRNEAKPSGKSPKVSAQSKSYVADVKAAEAELQGSIQRMMMDMTDNMKRRFGIIPETTPLETIQTAKMAV
jgi:regulator of protease activity HflC (stomatin/prohibitin superfamily)